MQLKNVKWNVGTTIVAGNMVRILLLLGLLKPILPALINEFETDMAFAAFPMWVSFAYLTLFQLQRSLLAYVTFAAIICWASLTAISEKAEPDSVERIAKAILLTEFAFEVLVLGALSTVL